MSSSGRLVYSTDPKLNQKCEKCRELRSECTCVVEDGVIRGVSGYSFVAILRIEKQARGGKMVTVIDKLPKNAAFLRELTSTLKKKCGSGGTYSLDGKEGTIEIQGDKREQIRAMLAKEGIKSKG